MKNTFDGIFCANEKGFGFVSVEGCDEDFFVPERNTGHAWDGDTVRIVTESSAHRKGKTEAKVTAVLERKMTEVVGTFERNGGFGFLVCDSKKIPWDIYIHTSNTKGALTGQKCVVKLTDYGSDRRSPEGIVTEILGYEGDKGVDILSLVRSYGAPTDFPEEVLELAGKLPKKLRKVDYRGRTDYRNIKTVTIDGDDSKDFDDAVSIERIEGGYILGVHIADVSHYVKEGSALDESARKRGNSIYLCDRVIPMLPTELSDNLCSLVEGQDRLTLSCVMTVNEKGKVVSSKITNSVICSDHRMTYSNVNLILSGDKKLRSKYKDMIPSFELMEELAEILKKRRKKRGSIEFDFPEADIILDENGHAVDVKKYDRGVSQHIIEEFMLLANETVAKTFANLKLPFLFRVHDVPDPESIEKLSRLIQKFGYVLKPSRDGVAPKDIAKLLSKIQGRDEEDFITTIALRSMQRALYTTENRGHFGLAAENYCHFTSPIRRYPDLQIHRIIKEAISGKLTAKRKGYLAGLLPAVAEHSCITERRADELERDVDKLKKAEYMSLHVGEEFDAKVTGVTRWGLYVGLENTVEGLVSIRTMRDDRYEYDDDNMELVGTYKNIHYTYGTPLRVRCTAVDNESSTIDFIIAGSDQREEGSLEKPSSEKKGKKAKKHKGKRHKNGGKEKARRK